MHQKYHTMYFVNNLKSASDSILPQGGKLLDARQGGGFEIHCQFLIKETFR